MFPERVEVVMVTHSPWATYALDRPPSDELLELAGSGFLCS